jgi:DNA (cytosine-5)-methyltransferase 1
MMRAVDLFAGFGGFTAGAELAGVSVVWAGNHSPLAVDVHSSNHPATTHVCQDLRQADWTTLPRYDLLLASPACQGHSRASQPRRRAYHDPMRATAWSVVDCADVTEPRAIVVENVVDFQRWRLFPEWCAALERIGYRLSAQFVTAADHGVPQLRERLFLVAVRKRRAFSLPLRLHERPPFAPCVEWESGAWRPVTKAGAGARLRIAAAQKRIGPRCLVQHVTGHRGVPLSEPIRTITTKDQWILVDGSRYRPLTLRELARGMGFSDGYTWPDRLSRVDVVRGLGNAVCPPVARDIVRAVAEVA